MRCCSGFHYRALDVAEMQPDIRLYRYSSSYSPGSLSLLKLSSHEKEFDLSRFYDYLGFVQVIFAGDRCDERDYCDGNPCVNGVCVSTSKGYHCNCVEGFQGNKCDLDINECHSNPCHRGKCINEVGVPWVKLFLRLEPLLCTALQ